MYIWIIMNYIHHIDIIKSIHVYIFIFNHIHIYIYSYIHPPVSQYIPLHQIKPICFTPFFLQTSTAKARVHWNHPPGPAQSRSQTAAIGAEGPPGVRQNPNGLVDANFFSVLHCLKYGAYLIILIIISYSFCWYLIWWVVLTIFKNISQWEGWHPIYYGK